MAKLKLHRIFEHTQIGEMQLVNRLVCPAMITNYATTDGFLTKRTLDHYETIAKSGVGLVIIEATCIDAPRGKGFKYQLVLDNDMFIPDLLRLTQIIKNHGAKVAIQLAHAGGSTYTDISHESPVGPSAIQRLGYDPCRELTATEIKSIVKKFGEAASRAKRAGIDGIEILGGHLYLISQFLSLAFNNRRDNYGGSLINRVRLLLEVIDEVKKSVGKDFPVWCRINGQEYGIPNGLTAEESQSVAVMLEKAGIDAIHVSAAGSDKYTGYNGGVMYDPKGNLVHLAEGIKNIVQIPVIAAGKIDLHLAENIIKNRQADLVAIGRPILADPDFLKKATKGKYDDIRPCIYCATCTDIFIGVKRTGVHCQVNASLGHMPEYNITQTKLKKKILVVGGGPSGMEAARVATLRGHEVSLYEKESSLGGQLVIAAIPPYKSPIQDFIKYLTSQIFNVGVRVKLGTKVTRNSIVSLRPDAVILATGAIPRIPKIMGLNRPSVFTAGNVLLGGVEVGQRVAIIGGGIIGCETADYLSERGHNVTIIEILPEVARSMGIRMKTRLLSRLIDKNVIILNNTNCIEITDEGIICHTKGNKARSLEIESVVLATGSIPNSDLYKEIKSIVPKVYQCGDCIEPRQIWEAIDEGFQIGLKC
ncbi:FAD-dependent oxidoreductase [Chloroflexota bacterium]